jgi:alkane 1-monooxygenase
MQAAKYLFVWLLPLSVAFSFQSEGIGTYAALIFAFVIVPLGDFFLGEDRSAPDESFRHKRVFDVILWLTVPTQLGILIWFLTIASHERTFSEAMGIITSMGLMCGVFGINVAHELGHRTSRTEQFLAQLMLTTSLYPHFFIEHNKGHHKNVATTDDPASARMGESVYAFWLRSIMGSWLSAWNISAKERVRKGLRIWSWKNPMVVYALLIIGIPVTISILLGMQTCIYFVGAALIGILLLETVNYIEHYGLSRKKVNEFRYQDVEPIHSWNADFRLGRIVLFDLTRHSDHHYEPAKPYQVLTSMEDSAQLPAGYPAMMLLSLIPPLWYKVMHPLMP